MAKVGSIHIHEFESLTSMNSILRESEEAIIQNRRTRYCKNDPCTSCITPFRLKILWMDTGRYLKFYLASHSEEKRQ